ncbi:hypothetical protein RBA63_03840 [Brenneria goodwinii]
MRVDGFDVIAVGVDNKRGVVVEMIAVGMIVRAQPRLTVVFAAGLNGRF